jgi:hypothetical protein
MEYAQIPEALRARLGEYATVELVELTERLGREASEHVLTDAEGRFERRLITESAQIRLETERGLSALRSDMERGAAALRSDMERGFSALRTELADTRVELIRWSFLFWIGQVAAMFGMVALMR